MIWSLPRTRDERLALALDYPYDAPAGSYHLNRGEVDPLDSAEAAHLTEGRTAVLAHGSNRAPAHLLRKFGPEASLPVTYGWLSGYDVVFGAHVARYGAITATLASAPGCRVRLAATWLTSEQLALMHESERMNYTYGRLPAAAFAAEVGPEPEELTLYAGNQGALLLDGQPVGLAALEAQGRPHPALTQRALQRQLHPGPGLEETLLARMEDRALRAAFAASLIGQGLDALTGFEPLARLDGAFA
ncbi:MAG: hypothetical protein AAFY02_10630 [Pseudomonadota bacterium]